MPLDEAVDRLLQAACPLGTEDVSVREACGRVAAEDVRAPRPVPHFPRAAMDGYVCHDADLAGASPERPVRLLITGRANTGDPPGAGPGPGEAWAITTGAPLPRRGDRVVPLEAARVSGGYLTVEHPGGAKRHIAEPGEDVRPGAILVERGTTVTPAVAAALAASGLPTVQVFRRPRVALVATGTELVEADDEEARELPQGRVVNSNAVALLGELEAAGCVATYHGIVADDAGSLMRAFGTLAAGYDVVLTTGGVSVGRSDLVHRTWLDLGASRLVGRIDLKPGGPFFAGRLGEAWAVGLSGTPVACLAAFHLLVRPLLRRISGARHAVRPHRPGILVHPFPRATDRMRALWARVVQGPGPLPWVELLVGAGHGTLASMLSADALVLVPPGTAPLPEGSRVTTLFLGMPEDRDRLEVGPARAGPLVVGVVGESGSGKTTVIAELLGRLRARGVRAAAVKHAAHGFQLDRPGSDSTRMAEAGAAVVVLAGPDELALRIPGAPPEVERAVQIALAAAGAADAACEVVLVEGFRHPGRPVIQVGPPKTPLAETCVWATLPRVGDVPPPVLAPELDRLAEALCRRLGRAASEQEERERSR